MEFENKLEIGYGIYTTPEVATILRLPYQKVHRWINEYWDKKLGSQYGNQYSWTSGKSRAVSFHTLVEFYVMMQFSEAGVKPRDVLTAHKELSNKYSTAFPFANRDVLKGINTDGKKIYFSEGEDNLSLDGTSQLNLEFIKQFFRKLDFDGSEIASRFWPMGRNSSIVVDPERKFGHPIIDGRNIYPETICNLHKAGEPLDYIAYIYELTVKQVKDALQYCSAA